MLTHLIYKLSIQQEQCPDHHIAKKIAVLKNTTLSKSVKSTTCNADSSDGSVPPLLVVFLSGDCTSEMLMDMGPPAVVT